MHEEEIKTESVPGGEWRAAVTDTTRSVCDTTWGQDGRQEVKVWDRRSDSDLLVALQQ